MLASEAAEHMMEEIYHLIYHALPRLPSSLPKEKKILKEGQFSILLILDAMSRENKEISLTEIADLTTYSRATITRETNRLGEELLIKKTHRTHPDARKVKVEIMPKGIEVLSEQKRIRKEVFEKLFTCLNQEEREHLIIGLRKMATSYYKD